MSSSDSLFSTLPQRIQNAIDDAFIHTAALHGDRAPGKISEGTTGGFVAEPATGGGFVVEDQMDTDDTHEAASAIPLELVPSALQRLDLPPDDEEVLSVFKNAASGWTSASMGAIHSDQQAKYVSKDDWRSVCAVLLEHRSAEVFQDDDESPGVEEDGSSSDDYIGNQPSDLSSLEDSSDEYQEGISRASHGKQPQRKRRSGASIRPSVDAPTSRQRQVCLEAFALFFPDVALEALETQRIKVSDLQRVSKLLGESIKADEVHFSTHVSDALPDRFINCRCWRCLRCFLPLPINLLTSTALRK